MKMTPRFFLIWIMVLSLGALISAYIGEYFFDLKPCVLCLYQRYIYMATVSVSFMGFVLSHRKQIAVIFVSSVLFFLNFCTATYQVLVEKKILKMAGACRIFDLNTQSQSFAQFQASFAKAGDHVPCDQVSFELFGISMAGYNAIFTLTLAIVCLVFARRLLNRDRF